MTNNKKTNTEYNFQLDIQLGKVPPQDVEVEKAILGAIMINSEAIHDIKNSISSEFFYLEAHKLIYKTFEKLTEKNKPIDLLTVANSLRDNNELEQIGGASYIANLTMRVASAINIEMHADILKTQYLRRMVIQGCAEMMQLAYNSNNIDELISATDFLNQDIMDVATKNEGIKHISEVLDKAVAFAKERFENNIKGLPNGLLTGLRAIDKKTSGFRGGHLIVMAARPGQGKTALALDIAKNISKDKNDVAFFSLEMQDIELADRLLLAESGIDPERYKSGTLDADELQMIYDAKDRLYDYSFYVDDKPLCSLSYIRTTAKVLKRKGKLKMIVIDYLQLADVRSKGMSREQEISNATRTLKALAKELDVPIILLSQLNREVEKRGDKMPQLSDLRESGAIEQDADIVVFLMRPVTYKGITKDSLMQDFANLPPVVNEDLSGLIIIDWAKIRNGSIGTTFAKHNVGVNKFEDYEYYSC